jgi:hypothetical protein
MPFSRIRTDREALAGEQHANVSTMCARTLLTVIDLILISAELVGRLSEI